MGLLLDMDFSSSILLDHAKFSPLARSIEVPGAEFMDWILNSLKPQLGPVQEPPSQTEKHRVNVDVDIWPNKEKIP